MGDTRSSATVVLRAPWMHLPQNTPHAGNDLIAKLHGQILAYTDRRSYSAIISPEPPNSFGKSFSFGRPSFICSTVSE